LSNAKISATKHPDIAPKVLSVELYKGQNLETLWVLVHDRLEEN